MKFNLTTSYAIRVVCYLHKYQKTTLTTLSTSLMVSPKYLTKVLKKLISYGLVSSTQGRYGGYKLADNNQKITIYDVYCAVENDVHIKSFENDAFFNQNDNKFNLDYNNFLTSIEKDLITHLNNKTIAELTVNFE